MTELACNCGKGKKAVGRVYIYTAANGARTTYNTEVEARAAKIRNGGIGTITPIARPARA